MNVTVTLNEFHSSSDIERVISVGRLRCSGRLTISADEAVLRGEAPIDVCPRLGADPSVKRIEAHE